MRILVTGACGFIGANLVGRLLDEGFEVAGVDSLDGTLYSASEKLDRAHRLRAEGATLFIEDLNLTSTWEGWKPEVIVHTAAIPGLRKAWENPKAQILGNYLATYSALESAIRIGVRRFIHISTSSVYGQRAGMGGRNLEPVSPYGSSKLAAEQIVRQLLGPEGIEFSVLRLFSVYGPEQRPDMAYRRIMEALLGHKPFEVFGSGEQTRANTHVSDVVSAILGAIRSEAGGSGLAFDIGGQEQVSLLQAISLIEKLTQRTLDVRFAPPTKGDQIEAMADISLARDLLGFRNQVSLLDGLESEWQWLLKCLQFQK